MVQDPNLAQTGGTVTDTTSFLASIEFLNYICPNEVEVSLIIRYRDRIAEHVLLIVLV